MTKTSLDEMTRRKAKAVIECEFPVPVWAWISPERAFNRVCEFRLDIENVFSLIYS